LDLKDIMYQKISAERKVWQQESELSRVTSETWMEAAATYIDLLAATESARILQSLEEKEQDVLKWAEALAKQEKSAQVMVEGARTAIASRRHMIVQMKQQADAASAKLAYLLGLGPDVCLVPADS